MTDERIDRSPDGQLADEDDDMDAPRDARDADVRRSTDDREANPLTREGPDAPDAADIEDPDEQL